MHRAIQQATQRGWKNRFIFAFLWVLKEKKIMYSFWCIAMDFKSDLRDQIRTHHSLHRKIPTRTHTHTHRFHSIRFCGVLNENCFWFYKLWPRIHCSSHADEHHLEIPSCFLIIFFHFQYFSFWPAQQGISSMRPPFAPDFAKRISTYHTHTHTHSFPLSFWWI